MGLRGGAGDYMVVSTAGSFSIHKEILDLKAKLSAKESELLRLECNGNTILSPGCTLGLDSSGSNSYAGSSGGDQSLLLEAEEWQAKYERLVEAHKKLQRNNICLEEKLLKVVDRYESDKNMMTRDLATQTQQVVEGKLTLQQLHKQNTQLKSDLQVALNLLQMKPSSFVSQKMESLPEDLQAQVKQYANGKQEERKGFRNGGQKITVAVPNEAFSADDSNAVSAAILAKVLEARENEREKDKKFCIDIGTQTHGWQFPDAMELMKQGTARKLLTMQPDYSLLEELGYLSSDKGFESSRDRLLIEKAFMEDTDYEESVDDDEDDEGIYSKVENIHTHVSNILLSSLIQTPPLDLIEEVPQEKPMKGYVKTEVLSFDANVPKFHNKNESQIVENKEQLVKHKNEKIEVRSNNPVENIVADFNLTSSHLSSLTSTAILSSQPATRSMVCSTPQTPVSSIQSSLSSILSLTQQATPTLTSNAFFKRSFSNTSYSAYQTDM